MLRPPKFFWPEKNDKSDQAKMFFGVGQLHTTTQALEILQHEKRAKKRTVFRHYVPWPIWPIWPENKGG